MKLFINFVHYKRLVLLVNVCALTLVQQSSGMMPSKRQQDIAFKRAQVIKARNMNDPVWVKTTDGRVVAIEQWKIDQMKAFQVMLVYQRGSNSQGNPLIKSENIQDEQWITSQELELLSDSLDAASAGQFEEFFTNIVDDNIVRMLIRAAGKVEATGISALCGTYVFPQDIQWLVIQDIVKPVVEYIEQHIKLEPKKFIGHGGQVKLVVFSPDGKKIVSSEIGDRNNLIVWDVENGKQLFNLMGHSDFVYCIAFSPDGKKIVSGSEGDRNNLILWDAENGNQLFNLAGHSEGVYSVAFSPDGKQIVSGGIGHHNNLIVWDVETGNQLLDLVGHPDFVAVVAFSSDSKKIVSGSWSYQDNLMVWDAASGDRLFNLIGHPRNIGSVVFSPDNKQIVSGCDGNNNNLVVWNAENGEQMFNLVGNVGDVVMVAFSPDGKKIVSGSSAAENNLIVWNAEDGSRLFNLQGHPGRVTSVALSSDGKKIVSGSSTAGNNLIVWNAEDGSRLFNLQGDSEHVTSVAFSPDGKRIASGTTGEKDNVMVWELPVDLINTIEKNLNIAQARLLYQMYCGVVSGMSMTIIMNSPEDIVYETLPDEVKKAAIEIFGVKVEKDFS